MPADPLDVVVPSEVPRWPRALREKLTSDLVPAGVLIPIVDRDAGLNVLLTQRSPGLKHHAGQVSFPGGRMEAGDADIVATALRETHEEVGIHPDEVEVAGFLDPSPTVTGYAVTPVVGLVAPGFRLAIDYTEVEAAFEVPLRFLLDRRNQQHSERDFEGTRVPIVEFNYESRRIWGATAAMLLMLRKTLLINN